MFSLVTALLMALCTVKPEVWPLKVALGPWLPKPIQTELERLWLTEPLLSEVLAGPLLSTN